MYHNTDWVDEIRDVTTHEIIQEGTDQSAGNFNNMEKGISDAHVASLILFSAMLPALRAGAVEEQTITLTNSKRSIPLNNSQQSIALRTARDRANYDVDITVIEATGSGIVGEWDVTDKMLNGFKLAYSGSASSVTAKITIKGGND